MNHPITLLITIPNALSDRSPRDHLHSIRTGLTKLLKDYPEFNVTEVLVVPHHVELDDVNNFHNKFKVPMATEPSFLDQAAHDYRLNFLKEELKEFDDSAKAGNLHDAADALVDLVYVALGTALMMGLPWPELWATVQERNMAKELALPDGSNSKRNNPLDVIKPDGWYPPNHWDTLGMSPFNTAPVFNATAEVLKLADRRKTLGD